MKKIIKLTESDLQRIVKRVIKEQEMEEGLGDAIGRLFSGAVKQLPSLTKVPYSVENVVKRISRGGISKIKVGPKMSEIFSKHKGSFDGAVDKLDSLISNEMGKFSKRFDVSAGRSPLQQLQNHFKEIDNLYFNTRVGNPLNFGDFIKNSWELKNSLNKVKLNYPDLTKSGQLNNIENVVNKYLDDIEQRLTKKYTK